jgi:hypothetical protein
MMLLRIIHAIILYLIIFVESLEYQGLTYIGVMCDESK